MKAFLNLVVALIFILLALSLFKSGEEDIRRGEEMIKLGERMMRQTRGI